jgi:hypothetical protein
MKVLITFAVAVMLSFSVLSQNTPPTPVVETDYFKVKDADIPAYLAVEKDWKKVHEERLKTGKIYGWMMFEVLLPSGSQVDHNYVTVTIYRSYADVENMIPDMVAAFGKAFPTANVAEKMAKSNTLRDRLKTDFQYNTAGFWIGNAQRMPDFKYANVSMMKVEEANEGLFEEQFKYWHKILTARTELGYDIGWQYGKVIRSHGTSDPYSDYLLHFFSDFQQSDREKGNWDKAAMKAYPTITPKEMGDKFSLLLKSRSVYRDELWRLVEVVK